MPNSIEVEGLRELSRTLRKLEDKELPKALKQTNKNAAEIVARDARAEVPVRSGKLQRSIKATATARTGAVRAGSKAVPYAGWIEFGGVIRFVEKAGEIHRPFIKDGRYMGQALQRNENEIRHLYEKEIDELVGRINR